VSGKSAEVNEAQGNATDPVVSGRSAEGNKRQDLVRTGPRRTRVSEMSRGALREPEPTSLRSGEPQPTSLRSGEPQPSQPDRHPPSGPTGTEGDAERRPSIPSRALSHCGPTLKVVGWSGAAGRGSCPRPRHRNRPPGAGSQGRPLPARTCYALVLVHASMTRRGPTAPSGTSGHVACPGCPGRSLVTARTSVGYRDTVGEVSGACPGSTSSGTRTSADPDTIDMPFSRFPGNHALGRTSARHGTRVPQLPEEFGEVPRAAPTSLSPAASAPNCRN